MGGLRKANQLRTGTGASQLPNSMDAAVAACVFVGLILVMVALRCVDGAVEAHTRGGSSQPSLQELTGFGPAATLTDREGRLLASSVPVYDLSVSPQSLWREHTPSLTARAVLGVLKGQAPEALSTGEARSFFRQMLPPQSEDSELNPASNHRAAATLVLRVEHPTLLRLNRTQREAVAAWLSKGAAPEEPSRGEIRGMRCVSFGPQREFTLEWTPEVLLSVEQRKARLGPQASARTWVNSLLDGLIQAVGAQEMHDTLRTRMGQDWARLNTADRRSALRSAVWAELLPSQFRIAARDIDVIQAVALREELARQGISTWQMKLQMRPARAYALRDASYEPSPFVDLSDEGPTDPIAIMGHWGRLDRAAAESMARRLLREHPDRLDWNALDDPLSVLTESLVHQPRPMWGLEKLAGEYLTNEPWVQASRSKVLAQRRLLGRDRRLEWRAAGQRVPSDLVGGQAGSQPPEVETTLDATVQQYLHHELETVRHTKGAALAMGIVLDPASGEVLAIDAVHGYRVSGFAPLQHVFTPGSTIKALVMAAALDQGLVQPGEMFPTYADQGGIQLGSRKITEARGAPKEPRISAQTALSRSVNAVMVQIGARVPADSLRNTLAQLGLGNLPHVGLGPEAGGFLPALDTTGAWSPNYTHASVSIGHELSVSLWQLASALSTLVRGGEQVPLRLVRAVWQEPNGEGVRYSSPSGERVFGDRACAQVREMMGVGATEGTGARVTEGHREDFDLLLSKTGTAQRVASEGCLHDEHKAQAKAAVEGRSLTRAERRALRGSRNSGHAQCYTSSICLVGKARGADRELMVLVVVEDATKRSAYSHFGSRVAGPVAMRVLRMAQGLAPELDHSDRPLPAGSRSEGSSSTPEALPRGLHAVSDQAWLGEGY